ncbi:PREDICTED: DNA damage-induced apoptosis suppressor protein [Dipodomys ordii]|uniref:DNA damage-induced apoptosis suppressor protein n=1 Tax=Dipodomys ordii TaxID=10020 RepID=A0A1S3EY62_DIPOR|nr:PREDICTED: DNA damage-induced apoptosis suppressor protein [Dipodomys ordii]
MNGRRKFLLASVLALQNSSFIYPSCQKCFSRIILVSKRFNCPKCGYTSEAENASYRYKLSVKVAESNKLFVITVFGSCLDTFFGLTATALHRYIQNLKVPKILDNDTTQNLLTKAVETCFLGQSFVFGVTNFEKQCGHGSASSNFLHQCYDHKREVQALVACQIVRPDPHVAGFTVIDFFHRLLQSSNSKEPEGHLLALNHSSSDLSSIHGSDSTSYLLESHSSNNFSTFWQPSLELTSIVSQLTENGEFSASEQNMAIGTLHQNSKYTSFAEITGTSSSHDPTQGSWSFVSYMDKNSTAEKKGKDSHSHQHFDIDTITGLHKKSTCCLPSSRRPEETAGCYQDCDSMIWDDLPLSESLNKFLAVIESEIAVTPVDAKRRKYAIGRNTHKCDADHNGSSVTLQIATRAVPPISSSLEATVKESSSKNNYLSNCEANASASIQKDLYPDNTADPVSLSSNPISLSSNEKDISEYFLSKTYLSAQFLPSQDLETTIILKKTSRIFSHRDEISLRPQTLGSDHSYVSAKYLNACGGQSHSEMKEMVTTLCPKKYSGVSGPCKLEKKQYYKWPGNQDDSFTICKKLTYPLETLHGSPNRSTNTLKETPNGHTNTTLTQSYPADLEGSYNASADLFNNIAKNMDTATEITKRSQDVMLQGETSLTENCPAESDILPRSHSANSSQSSQKVLQSLSASRYPRTCSPPPQFHSDSEYDFEDSQDFVPCSQSTPVTGFHRTRIHGINGTFRNLTAFYCDCDANDKKIQVPSENDKQQIIPSCPKNFKTPTQKSRSHITSRITPPEVFNHSPIAECLKTDSDEWVPPTTQKVFISDMLGFQVMALRKCLDANNCSNQKELPRKKQKQVKQRTSVCLIKKEFKNRSKAKQKSPKCNSERSVCISKESVLGLDSFSEVRSCLPFSENRPPFMAESTWSPELFS